MNDNTDPIFKHTWEQSLNTATVHFHSIFKEDLKRIRFTPSAVVIELNDGLEFIGGYLGEVEEASYIFDEYLILEIFKKNSEFFEQVFETSEKVDKSKIIPKTITISQVSGDLRVFVENMIKTEVEKSEKNEKREKILQNFMQNHPELDFSEMSVNYQ